MKYGELAEKLKPYILQWNLGGSSSSGGAGMVPHRMDGPYHLGASAFLKKQDFWSLLDEADIGGLSTDSLELGIGLQFGTASDVDTLKIETNIVGSVGLTAQPAINDTLQLGLDVDTSTGLQLLPQADKEDTTLHLGLDVKARKGLRTVTNEIDETDTTLFFEIDVDLENPGDFTFDDNGRLKALAYSDAVAHPEKLLRSDEDGNIRLGTLTTDKVTSHEYLTLDAARQIYVDADMESTDHRHGSEGWGITQSGDADFRNIEADTFTVDAFVANVTRAMNNTFTVTYSRSRLAAPFSGKQGERLVIEDEVGLEGHALCRDGDQVWVSYFNPTSSGFFKGHVYDYIDRQDGTQSWRWERIDGPSNIVAGVGSIILNYGKPGDGVWTATASKGGYAESWRWNPKSANNSNPRQNAILNYRAGMLRTEDGKGIAGLPNGAAGFWGGNDAVYFTAGSHGLDMGLSDEVTLSANKKTTYLYYDPTKGPLVNGKRKGSIVFKGNLIVEGEDSIIGLLPAHIDNLDAFVTEGITSHTTVTGLTGDVTTLGELYDDLDSGLSAFYGKDSIPIEMIANISDVVKHFHLGDIPDGGGFKKVKGSALTEDGLVVLDATVSEIYAHVQKSALTAQGLVIYDHVVDTFGEYAKVLATSVQAGKIVLSQVTGNLDDVADGDNRGAISTTTIEGGRIQIGQGQLHDDLSGFRIDETGIFGQREGSTQVWLNTLGQIVAGGGSVMLHDNGIDIEAGYNWTFYEDRTSISWWRNVQNKTQLVGGITGYYELRTNYPQGLRISARSEKDERKHSVLDLYGRGTTMFAHLAADRIYLSPTTEMRVAGAPLVTNLINPVSDNLYDLGLLNKRWRNIYGKTINAGSVLADELRVDKFIADASRVFPNTVVISKSRAVLAENATTNGHNSIHIYVYDNPQGLVHPSVQNPAVAAPLMSNGDAVTMISTETASGGLQHKTIIGFVSDYVNMGNGTQRWAFAPIAHYGSAVIKAGTTLLDYGHSNVDGYLQMTAEPVHGPYSDVRTWWYQDKDNYDTNIWVRTGRLDELTGGKNEYGIYIRGKDNTTIVASNKRNLEIKADGNNVTNLDAGNLTTGFVNADRIGANTITTSHLTANSVTANELNVTKLAAIATDTGTLNVDEIIRIAGGDVTLDDDGLVMYSDGRNIVSAALTWRQKGGNYNLASLYAVETSSHYYELISKLNMGHVPRLNLITRKQLDNSQLSAIQLGFSNAFPNTGITLTHSGSQGVIDLRGDAQFYHDVVVDGIFALKNRSTAPSNVANRAIIYPIGNQLYVRHANNVVRALDKDATLTIPTDVPLWTVTSALVSSGSTTLKNTSINGTLTVSGNINTTNVYATYAESKGGGVIRAWNTSANRRTGYVEFYDEYSQRGGYIGWALKNGPLLIHAENTRNRIETNVPFWTVSNAGQFLARRTNGDGQPGFLDLFNNANRHQVRIGHGTGNSIYFNLYNGKSTVSSNAHWTFQNVLAKAITISGAATFQSNVTIGDNIGLDLFTVNAFANFHKPVELKSTAHLVAYGGSTFNSHVQFNKTVTFANDITVGNLYAGFARIRSANGYMQLWRTASDAQPGFLDLYNNQNRHQIRIGHGAGSSVYFNVFNGKTTVSSNADWQVKNLYPSSVYTTYLQSKSSTGTIRAWSTNGNNRSGYVEFYDRYNQRAGYIGNALRGAEFRIWVENTRNRVETNTDFWVVSAGGRLLLRRTHGDAQPGLLDLYNNQNKHQVRIGHGSGASIYFNLYNGKSTVSSNAHWTFQNVLAKAITVSGSAAFQSNVTIGDNIGLDLLTVNAFANFHKTLELKATAPLVVYGGSTFNSHAQFNKTVTFANDITIGNLYAGFARIRSANGYMQLWRTAGDGQPGFIDFYNNQNRHQMRIGHGTGASVYFNLFNGKTTVSSNADWQIRNLYPSSVYATYLQSKSGSGVIRAWSTNGNNRTGYVEFYDRYNQRGGYIGNALRGGPLLIYAENTRNRVETNVPFWTVSSAGQFLARRTSGDAQPGFLDLYNNQNKHQARIGHGTGGRIYFDLYNGKNTVSSNAHWSIQNLTAKTTTVNGDLTLTGKIPALRVGTGASSTMMIVDGNATVNRAFTVGGNASIHGYARVDDLYVETPSSSRYGVLQIRDYRSRSVLGIGYGNYANKTIDFAASGLNAVYFHGANLWQFANPVNLKSHVTIGDGGLDLLTVHAFANFHKTVELKSSAPLVAYGGATFNSHAQFNKTVTFANDVTVGNLYANFARIKNANGYMQLWRTAGDGQPGFLDFYNNQNRHQIRIGHGTGASVYFNVFNGKTTVSSNADWQIKNLYPSGVYATYLQSKSGSGVIRAWSTNGNNRTGYVEFYDRYNQRGGYIGYALRSGPLLIYAENTRNRVETNVPFWTVSNAGQFLARRTSGDAQPGFLDLYNNQNRHQARIGHGTGGSIYFNLYNGKNTVSSNAHWSIQNLTAKTTTVHGDLTVTGKIPALRVGTGASATMMIVDGNATINKALTVGGNASIHGYARADDLYVDTPSSSRYGVLQIRDYRSRSVLGIGYGNYANKTMDFAFGGLNACYVHGVKTWQFGHSTGVNILQNLTVSGTTTLKTTTLNGHLTANNSATIRGGIWTQWLVANNAYGWVQARRATADGIGGSFRVEAYNQVVLAEFGGGTGSSVNMNVYNGKNTISSNAHWRIQGNLYTNKIILSNQVQFFLYGNRLVAQKGGTVRTIATF